MHNFTFPEETDDIVDIGIIAQAEDVIVGHAGFLLCGKIFGQIGDHIALYLHGGGAVRPAGSCGGENTGCMVHEIRVESTLADLVVIELAGKLMNNGADHFQVVQFLSTD